MAQTGELAGSTTAAQMPSVSGSMVRFKARDDNAGNVYIGYSGVTKPNGSTDTTTGFPLDAGDDSGWVPFSSAVTSGDNLNDFYYICDNAGDDLIYWVL
jgi:hypothetical protein